MGKCDDCQHHFERRSAFAARTNELYELLIKPLRYVAKKHGYALALHGTVNYDIDLVAVPWRDGACDPDSLVAGLVEVVKAIHYVADEVIRPASQKPQGRLGYVIHLSHDFGNGPYIDLSVMPPLKKIDGAMIERAARELFRIGNERIGERAWDDVSQHYLAEAEASLKAAFKVGG